MGGWCGSCGEDCRRGSEGSEMAAVVENRGREFTGERTMEGLDSGRRRMVGGKREITPEREMVVMGMEMQGWGRGNQDGDAGLGKGKIVEESSPGRGPWRGLTADGGGWWGESGRSCRRGRWW